MVIYIGQNYSVFENPNYICSEKSEMLFVQQNNLQRILQSSPKNCKKIIIHTYKQDTTTTDYDKQMHLRSFNDTEVQMKGEKGGVSYSLEETRAVCSHTTLSEVIYCQLQRHLSEQVRK